MKTRTLMTALSLATALAVPAQAQTDTWEIDTAHSQSTFSVKHLMVTTVRGQFGKTSGKVQWNGKDVSTISVEATIDATTINTREQKRDDHLRSADFFDVEKFPTITFKSKRVEAASGGKFKLVGDLTMRGVTKEVVLDVEGPTSAITDMQGNQRVGATATTRLNRKDFNIVWNRALDGGGVVVSDEVDVTIDLALVKRSAATGE
ncbi:MAG: YceI family protein [Acidobacteria bacterium]|nr:YceI family protein [Acidobacteriota bacterium]